MARSGGGVYSLPAGSLVTDGVDDILASQHNTPLQDIAADLNVARPIVAGGTGATTAADAITELSAGAETTATDATDKMPNSRALFRGRGWTYAAAQNTTSGSTVDFIGIPSWATEVVVLFVGVGLSAGDDLTVQIGHSGGLVTTGYSAAATLLAGGTINCIGSSTGFQVRAGAAADSCYGTMTLTKVNDNFWNSTHSTFSNFGRASCGGGGVFIPAIIDRVRLAQTGASTFDFGSVRIGWR